MHKSLKICISLICFYVATQRYLVMIIQMKKHYFDSLKKIFIMVSFFFWNIRAKF